MKLPFRTRPVFYFTGGESFAPLHDPPVSMRYGGAAVSAAKGAAIKDAAELRNLKICAQIAALDQEARKCALVTNTALELGRPLSLQRAMSPCHLLLSMLMPCF